MICAKMNDGFAVEVEEAFLNDSELIEAMVHADKDPTAYFLLRDRMLSAADKTRLYDHLRNEKGIVPFDALCTALNELMTSSQAGKNSASSPN